MRSGHEHLRRGARRPIPPPIHRAASRASGAITTVTVGFSIAGAVRPTLETSGAAPSIGATTLSGKTLAAGAPGRRSPVATAFIPARIIAGNPDTGVAIAGKARAVKINKVGTVAGSGSILGGGGMHSGSLFGGAGIASVYLGGDSARRWGRLQWIDRLRPGVAPGVGVGLLGAVTVKGSLLGSPV